MKCFGKRGPTLGSVEGMIGALGRAFGEANRLGHQWVGPQHVLLAVLGGEQGSVAVEAMNGLTVASFEEHFLGSLLRRSPPVRSEVKKGPYATPAPIFYRIDGWTTGYAAATGVAASDEIVLLALCSILERPLSPGHSRADVAQVVTAALGLPALDVPPDRGLGRERVDVPIERLDRIRTALLEADLLVGFNVDRENNNAWVIVKEANERARSVIAAALADNPSGT